MDFKPTSAARSYWDLAADSYARDFTTTLIGQKLRAAIWRDLDRAFSPGQRVLELNCGTGLDAVHLAQRGISVLACDISGSMVEKARQLADAAKFGDRIEFRVLATEQIGMLDRGRFDGAFSNFSGLNCVGDLAAVRQDLARLLKPRATVVLCMLGRFVPWEMLWFLMHGDISKATRRLKATGDCDADVGTLKVHYYSRQKIVRSFAPEFLLRRWKGLGIALPPSYIEHLARCFPKATNALDGLDGLLGSVPGFRNMADFVLLEFERQKIMKAHNADPCSSP
jgi:SAM-dependent methyltransferase